MYEELRKNLATKDPELAQAMNAMNAIIRGDKDGMQKLHVAQVGLKRKLNQYQADFINNLKTLQQRI